MSIKSSSTKVKSSTTKNGSSADPLLPSDNAETAISQLTMKPITSKDDHTPIKLPRKCSSVEEVDNESKSDEDKYKEDVYDRTINQSIDSMSTDNFVPDVSYKPEFT